MDEPNDHIDVITTLPRKTLRAFESVDSTRVFMMKEKLQQLTMNYEQDKYANQLMMEGKRAQFAYQRDDLEYERVMNSIGIASNVLGSVANIAGAGMYMAAVQGTSRAPYAKRVMGMTAGGVINNPGLAANIAALIRHPTLMKRIDETEQRLITANTQQLYQRKMNYESDFRWQTLRLNKVAGSYEKPTISNRDAQEQYNEDRFGKGVNVVIEILLPSEDQQIQIDHIYDTFGCECVSDYFERHPLSIYDDMEEGLYKFSKIKKGGILSSITDITLRDILRQILENGVKFEGCQFEVDDVDVVEEQQLHVAIPKRPKVIFDPLDVKNWAIEK